MELKAIKTELLEKIDSPKDLKKLKVEQLKELSDEIRRVLLNTCSVNGGHIGANLGVVELSVALHYVFNSPEDKFLFDTSHQSYTHKILTGRRKYFHTICIPKGIPRFTVRGETEHDHWSAGHASTALSGAMGMAEARKTNKKEYEVIAITGDGALGGGMCYEALNNIGYNQTNMIIILNDNKMSISSNVGAMYKHLKKLSMITDENRGRREVGTIFEKMGIQYYGPFDGHNIEKLVEELERIKDLSGPRLIHVLTIKGKGMDYMENDKANWHEHSAFDIETGEPTKKSPVSIEKIAVEDLIKLAEKDSKVVAITAAMPAGTGLLKFGEKFHERFYDVGIAEEHAVTFAAGLAAEETKPFVVIYSPFLQRGFDQIAHDVALQKLPVRFMIPKASITGDGPTQGGILDFSYLRIIPNMVVMAPKDENELGNMVVTAYEYNDGPISVRYPKGTPIGVEIKESKALEIGKGEMIRKGKDISLISIGFMLKETNEAAEILKKEGIEAEVINARFVKPLDEKMICDSLKKTGKGITIEENILPGGFGSAVLEMLEDKGLNEVELHRIGAPDAYIDYDAPAEIKKSFGMDSKSIAKKAKKMLGK
ncbi:MAG: 1-deoxy-D-xylulose-5-phosphate synthase [Candidatus Diapherotrites archaeon CG10_big_fil_rev_8_21_14_0_10_31_34]|nr:MAG: 1-deoxy-D-xylulose-5-phosphate synthase [Candidatus Diapherotrites archaeon CG10_big_fil_rev_8_21_14_0_10_31_34]